MMNRLKIFGSVALGIASLIFASQTAAQTYPSRPIKLIVPFAPGGSNDTISRVMAQELGKRLGQSVVVYNRGGGGGTLGTEMAVNAVPDGYTLLFGSTSLITNAATAKELPYDIGTALTPIGQVASGAFAVVVSNKTKISTFADLIREAKAHPGALAYGSAGIGGINHMGTELLASAAGIKMLHVPYKGIGPAFTDLIGGQLQVLVPSLASAVPYIQSGKMRGLAVTGPHRSPLLPKLPTVGEAGIPGFTLEVWWGMFAPAGTPDNIVERLNKAVNAVLEGPEIRAQLAREGADPSPGTPEAFGAVMKNDLAKWKKLARAANIQTQ